MYNKVRSSLFFKLDEACMARKFKRRKYGGKRRRLRKSKYGKFRRGVRKILRKFSRSKMLVPRNTLAAKSCFIKVRQTTRFLMVSPADTIYFEQVIRGNGLHDTCLGTSGDFSDKKLFYYGRLYDRYYCYASRIRLTIVPLYNATATIAQFPVLYSLIPSLNTTDLGSAISYAPNEGKPTIQLQPHARYKWKSGPVYGMNAGIIKLKSKMSTKKMWGKNTKTDNDFIRDIFSQTDTQIKMDNPLNEWYWHILCFRPDLTAGTHTAGQINCEIFADIEWSVMLTTNLNPAAVIANDLT